MGRVSQKPVSSLYLSSLLSVAQIERSPRQRMYSCFQLFLVPWGKQLSGVILWSGWMSITHHCSQKPAPFIRLPKTLVHCCLGHLCSRLFMAHSLCRDSKVYIIFKWIRPLFIEVWQLTRLSFFLLHLTPLPQIHCGQAAGYWVVRVDEQNCLPFILIQSADFHHVAGILHRWHPPWIHSPIRSLALDTQCFVLL